MADGLPGRLGNGGKQTSLKRRSVNTIGLADILVE